jgi:hypothetical protein
LVLVQNLIVVLQKLVKSIYLTDSFFFFNGKRES